MPRPLVILLAAFATAALAGCTDDKRYPLSGEECAPGDPVQSVDPAADNCVPAA